MVTKTLLKRNGKGSEGGRKAKTEERMVKAGEKRGRRGKERREEKKPGKAVTVFS